MPCMPSYLLLLVGLTYNRRVNEQELAVLFGARPTIPKAKYQLIDAQLDLFKTRARIFMYVDVYENRRQILAFLV